MSYSQRDYWRFYWPLGLMAVALFSGRLVQNYVLLDYEGGVRELAIFSLAIAAFKPFQAVLGFVPQMSNVLVRGPRTLRASFRFLLGVCAVFTLPVALLGWTPLGDAVLSRIYDVGPDRIAVMTRYMRYFVPLIVLGAVGRFFIGLLVQAHRTGVVTALRVSNLALMIVTLVVGIELVWDPVITISMSLLLPRTVQMLLAGGLVYALHDHRQPGKDQELKQREVGAYFLPMVGTTILFTLSRPIIFGFLTSLDPEIYPGLPPVDAMVAGVSLAFGFSMLFQSTINQFRNVFVTFGHRDLRGVRRFMARVTLGVASLMLIALLTPGARLFLRHLQGATGPTLEMAKEACWVLLLVPVVVAWRNYFHGLAMVHRRTGGMVAGAVSRNASIAVVAAALVAVGLYNHVAAAALLVLGFASEAFTVFLYTRPLRRRLAARTAPAAED